MANFGFTFFLDLFIFRFFLCKKNFSMSRTSRGTLRSATRVNLHVCCFHISIQHFSITKLTLDFVLQRENETTNFSCRVNRSLVKASKANDFCFEEDFSLFAFLRGHFWDAQRKIFECLLSYFAKIFLPTLQDISCCAMRQVPSIKIELIYWPKVQCFMPCKWHGSELCNEIMLPKSLS